MSSAARSSVNLFTHAVARRTRAALGAMLLGTGLMAAPRSAMAQAQCGNITADPMPQFGEIGLFALRFDLVKSLGFNSHQVQGTTTTWSYLMPDGVTFNANRLQALDVEIRSAVSNGMKEVEVRVLPGGGALNPFNGSQSNWPVDTDTYTTKDGEWLGPQPLSNWTTGYPPRQLTRDQPGNTSPWYEFVKALAARYNGCTPDPDPLYAGKFLPRVDYWSSLHEPDSKGFFYGTSKEMFGGVGGDPAVGMQPSFYRAVKAANPNAKVVSGGLSSHTVGYYMAYEKAKTQGNLYNQTVRDWGKSFFHTSNPLQAPFSTYVGNDAGLFQHYATDPEEVRTRTIIDALFTATADDYYDVLGTHFYDNPQMFEDFIGFHETRQLVSKPIWITELGFVDQPAMGQPGVDSESQAQWLLQKLVVAVASGVEHTDYSPIMSSPTAPGFMPLFDGLPSNPTWRSAATTAQLVATSLNEDSGFTFFKKRLVAGGVFYEFAHSDGNQHLAYAWHPTGTTIVDLRQTFSIPPTAPINVFDYKGQALWTDSTQSSYTVTTAPVQVRWSGTAAPGCGRLGGQGPTRVPVTHFAIVLLPVLRLMLARRVRRARPLAVRSA